MRLGGERMAQSIPTVYGALSCSSTKTTTAPLTGVPVPLACHNAPPHTTANRKKAKQRSLPVRLTATSETIQLTPPAQMLDQDNHPWCIHPLSSHSTSRAGRLTASPPIITRRHRLPSLLSIPSAVTSSIRCRLRSAPAASLTQLCTRNLSTTLAVAA